jgi:hypothetical protein
MTAEGAAAAAAGRAPSRTIDLYVAGGLAQDAAQRDRLRALGIDLEAAGAMHARATGELLERPGGATLDAAVSLFGSPTVRRVERVAWDLVFLPGHRYEFRLRDDGIDAGEVVRRDEHVLLPGAPPPSLVAARTVFRPWFHTRRDVGRVLGDPERDDRGHPHESAVWHLRDASEVQCDFAHGLLLRVGAARLPRAAPRETEASEARPWWAFWRR